MSKPVNAAELEHVIAMWTRARGVVREPTPEPFDLRSALNRVGGSQEFLVTLARTFCRNLPGTRAGLMAAIAERSTAGVDSAAHANVHRTFRFTRLDQQSELFGPAE